LKTHKFIECKYADTENLFKKAANRKRTENLFDSFLDFDEKTSFLPMTFDELFAFIAQISGLLSRSGKALADNFDLHVRCELYRIRNDEDFVASEWKELRRIHLRSQTQTRNFKRHWPHRYELIDFPCSLQSFDLPDFLIVWPFSFNISDNLHENFSALNTITTKVITLTTPTKLAKIDFRSQKLLSVSGSKNVAQNCSESSLFDIFSKSS
jgi:hypothetical protein